MEDSKQPPGNFARRVFPWIIVVATACLYWATMHNWVSLTSLPLVAKVTGWDWWNPVRERPVFLLATLPIRMLAPSSQVFALNLFTVLCAALSLGLLARSVALMPQDRTRDQRVRERGGHGLLSTKTNWLPPLVGVMVCGLQLTYWEHATAATGEAFDLLIFAYVIRCLLEYRINKEPGWLCQMALVYGLGAANNWAMVGFGPLFLVAVIWVMGREFFRLRFLARTGGFLLAGLSAYLILPLVPALNNAPYESFGEILRFELGAQKNILLAFPRWVVLMLGLTSLLPVFLAGIRWPSSVGDTNAAATILATFVLRVVHVALLAMIVWVAFDPKFSPRNLGFGFPFLTFYYLGALAAGYFTGYALLLFGQSTVNAWEKPSTPVRLINGLMTCLLWLGAAALPAGLVWQNWAKIKSTNGPAVRQYAGQLAEAVPADRGMVLAANTQQLLLLTAARAGASTNQLLIDLPSLDKPNYHHQALVRYPGRVPALSAGMVATNRIAPGTIAQWVDYMARTNETFVLGPVYGVHFLEVEYLEPRGLVFNLKPYGELRVGPPPLSAEIIAANEAAWEKLWPQMRPPAGDRDDARNDANVIAAYYSASLNYWAVQLRKAGKFEEAGRWLDRALTLNEFNTSAKINKGFRIQPAPNLSPTNSFALELKEQFPRYRTWNNLLSANGPLDEPYSCYLLGTVYASGRLLRQAALQFQRAQHLAPDSLAPRLALGNVFVEASMVPEVLALVKETRALPVFKSLAPEDDVSLLRLEAFAQLKEKPATAEALLQDGIRKYPQNVPLQEALAEVYIQTRRITNALAVIEKVLSIAPNQLSALLTESAITMELRDFKRALKALDLALKIQPNHLGAKINRANANLGAGNYAAAERDFLVALEYAPNLAALHFGLASAVEKQDRKPEAVRHLENTLRLLPASHPQAKSIQDHIQQLKGK